MIIWSNVPDKLTVQYSYQLPYLSKLQSQPRVTMTWLVQIFKYQFCTGPGHNDNPTETSQGSQPSLDIFTSQRELSLLSTEPAKGLEKYGDGYVGFYFLV